MFMQRKQSTRHKVCAKLLSSNSLSRDEASKLRGDVQWLFSSCAGNAAKYAGPLLRQAQTEGRPSLLAEERTVLQCVRQVVLAAHPKVVMVPSEVIAEWYPRKQQIFAGETLAVLILPLLYPETRRSADVLWFVDKQGAVSAAITGSSKEGDVHEIAHFAAVLRFNLGFRVFLRVG